jgi:hypothetical protein
MVFPPSVKKRLGVKLHAKDLVLFMMNWPWEYFPSGNSVNLQTRGDVIDDERVVPGNFQGVGKGRERDFFCYGNKACFSMNRQIRFPGFPAENFIDALHPEAHPE